jgi:hypothetical protein
MYDLFRFMVLRPPESVDANATISVDSHSDFITSLREASQSDTPLASMQHVAESFTQSDQFVGKASSLAYSQQYQAVMTDLKDPPAELTFHDLKVLVKKAFQADATQVITEKGFLKDRRRVADSLVAIQLAALPQDINPEFLTKACQVINLIQRVGKEDLSLNQSGAIQESLNQIMVLPADLFPVPSTHVPPAPPPAPDPAKNGTGADNSQADLIAHATALYQAQRVFNNMATESTPPIASPSVNPAVKIATTLAASANDAHILAANAKRQPLDIPSTSSTSGPVIDAAILQAFSPPVQKVLSNLNLDFTTASPSLITDSLNVELTNTMGLLAASHSGVLQNPIYGSALIPDPFHEPSAPAEWQDNNPAPFPFPPSTPNPQVKPAGIADLLVVREHVLSYEPGEIAFVENVARGESFKRHTRRKNVSESSTLTTTFSSSETEHDLQSTDRFGLQRQSQNTIQDKAGSVAGMGISNAYGPLVDSSGSSQNTSSQVSTYGQEITRQAVSKMTQSLETQVLQRTTSEFDEAVEHDFNNAAGAKDQIVVYQWLDKIVQAKVFTYGKRVLYDIIVPEPAEFLDYEMQKWQPELAALQKPTLFPLEAQWLSDDPKNNNYYQYWASGYGATGIQPAPEPQVNIAKTYGNVSKVPFGNQPVEARSVFEVGKDNVPIPEGYKASSVTIMAEAEIWNDAGIWINVDIGKTFVQLNDPNQTPVTLALNGEVREIPLTVYVSGGPAIYSVTVDIVCVRTAQAMAQWQSRTYDAILQASRDRLAEYEDRLNTLKAALTIKVAGKSPEEKQALIRAELEKSCISILSNQHFDAFDAVEFVVPKDGKTPQDYMPQLYLPNVGPMGRYIRFFQEAFEWDQILYLYYPYFWGRKKYWNDQIQLDDQDPEFAAFLSAGAARVTVPVRLGYEQAVADFMNKGIVPTEADLLSGVVTTGLYVPFFAEMMGDQGGPDTAKPYGDPPLEWELRVPTTLIKVRTDNTLPKWASDTWTPVNPGDSETP